MNEMNTESILTHAKDFNKCVKQKKQSEKD